MNKFLNYLFVFIIAVTGLFALKQYIDANKLSEEITAYQDSLDAKYKTIEKWRGLYETTSRKVDNIKSTKDSLNNYLKKANKKINLQSNVIIALSDSIKNIETKADTIYLEDSTYVNVRTFNKQLNWIYISGYFEVKKPFRIHFDSLRVNISLNINYVKNKSGEIETYVTSPNSNVSFSDINTKNITNNDTFYDKVGFFIGSVGFGNYLALYGGISYDNLKINLGYGTAGSLIGVEYIIK